MLSELTTSNNQSALKSVLILVVMEYALGEATRMFTKEEVESVLILVVMEYALGATKKGE